jgi:hypothetical protein
MLDHVQIIKDKDQARFAVIPYEEFIFLRQLLNDQDKLADYLDFLHVKSVKAQGPPRLTLDEVKEALELD